MSKFSIKTAEKKTLGTTNFHEEKNYKVVKLLKSGKVTMLHVLQADALIKAKKAELVKDVEITSKTGKRTSVKIDDK